MTLCSPHVALLSPAVATGRHAHAHIGEAGNGAPIAAHSDAFSATGPVVHWLLLAWRAHPSMNGMSQVVANATAMGAGPTDRRALPRARARAQRRVRRGPRPAE